MAVAMPLPVQLYVISLRLLETFPQTERYQHQKIEKIKIRDSEITIGRYSGTYHVSLRPESWEIFREGESKTLVLILVEAAEGFVFGPELECGLKYRVVCAICGLDL